MKSLVHSKKKSFSQSKSCNVEVNPFEVPVEKPTYSIQKEMNENGELNFSSSSSQNDTSAESPTIKRKQLKSRTQKKYKEKKTIKNKILSTHTEKKPKKVTFTTPLVEIINVKSYKKYNIFSMLLGQKHSHHSENNKCQCSVF